MPSKAEIKRMKKHAAKSRIKGKNKLLRGGSRTGGGLSQPPSIVPVAVTSKEVPLLKRDLFELGLSYNVIDILSSGSYTVGELIQKTEKDLLALSGIGPVSLKHIKVALAKKGLALKQS
jgi:DNA-directed RNA polymerase alpha subunit